MDLKQLKKLIEQVQVEKKQTIISEGVNNTKQEALIIIKMLMELSPQKLQQKINDIVQSGQGSEISGVTGIIRGFKGLSELGKQLENTKLPKPADQLIDDPSLKQVDIMSMLTEFYDLNMLDMEKNFHPVVSFLINSTQDSEETKQMSTPPISPSGDTVVKSPQTGNPTISGRGPGPKK